MRLRTMTLTASLLLAALPCPAPSCILCSNIRQSASLRQEALSRNARLVLFGTLSNARLDGARPGSGKTDFTIAAVLKIDPRLPGEQQKCKGDVLVLPHYLPPMGAGAPAYYLVFCDVAGKRYDPYRSVAVSAAAATYFCAER